MNDRTQKFFGTIAIQTILDDSFKSSVFSFCSWTAQFRIWFEKETKRETDRQTEREREREREREKESNAETAAAKE